MNHIDIGKLGAINASEIALGCMRISGMDRNSAETLISAAIDSGINFFDHADIYGGGKSEEVFASAFHGSRDSIYIQSKCGIRQGFFDFSKEHIISSAEASLKRLKTDYLELLLLHRPDALMEPEEVAGFSAFPTRIRDRCLCFRNICLRRSSRISFSSVSRTPE